MNGMKLMTMMIICFVASACASPPPRTLQLGETELNTWDETPVLFHSALYYPSEISLRFPGYVIGIEKSPKGDISQEGDVQTVSIPNAGEKMGEHIARIGDDEKLLYISHIVESFGRKHGEGNCAHYNAYYRAKDEHSPVEFCDPSEKHQVHPQAAYVQSWEALKILKGELSKKIENAQQSESGGYTHILVGMMGWNTDQAEAIRNFNSVAKNMVLAAEKNGDAFRPLFIGLTWPSKWAADWITPIVTLFSYGNKADDADEVGFGWLGVLLHDTLRDLPGDVPIVVLGHSFGARVSSMGVCMGPAITQDGKLIPRNTIDLLIGLQGAYSINRYERNKGKEGIYYPGEDRSCENAKHVVLTASKYDKAMDNKSYVPFVGNNTTYKDYCKKKSNIEFECVTATSEGNLSTPLDRKSHKTYINANDLINYNAYGSGGLAHSDIYRKEMGVLLWNVISGKVHRSN